MRRVIFNQKGGVGKSTLTCNLAAISAHYGIRTLIIDLDPQANASQYLLGTTPEPDFSLAGLYEEILNYSYLSKLDKYIHATPFPHLDIMTACSDLEVLQSKLAARYKIYKLKELLDNMDNPYQAVYFDTPPAMNFFARAALIAASHCLIPFDCDTFARNALFQLISNIKELKLDHNAQLEIEGIVVNQFQHQAKLPKAMVDALIDQGLPILKPYLSSSVIVRSSHEAAKPLIHFAAKHKLTQELIELFKQLQHAAKQHQFMDSESLTC